jgi:hypothetical protein
VFFILIHGGGSRIVPFGMLRTSSRRVRKEGKLGGGLSDAAITPQNSRHNLAMLFTKSAYVA